MTVLRAILAPAEALLGSNALAHVVTSNPDGTPQVSVVWCAARGDQILFCTEAASAKVRNLRRDPAVVLSIEDEERNHRGAQQHLLVYGRAEIVPGKASKELCDELCRVYTGQADHELNLSRSPSALTVSVAVGAHRVGRRRPHRRQRPLDVGPPVGSLGRR